MLYYWRPDSGLQTKGNEEFVALNSKPDWTLLYELFRLKKDLITM